MDNLKISNLNLYRSLKSAPYNLTTALAQLINHSISCFIKNNDLNTKSIIILYINLDQKLIQIMDNSKGICNQNEYSNLWKIFDDPKAYNPQLIASSFFLGNLVSIESKNEEQAFSTSLNINEECTEAKINFYKSDEIFRIFNHGNRITIELLNIDLDIKEMHETYKQLSFIFNHVLYEFEPSIIFGISKDNNFIDPSSSELKVVSNMSSIKKLDFKLPEYNNIKTIKDEFEMNFANKKIIAKFCAYQFLLDKKHSGISISNQEQVIEGYDILIKPNWFNDDYDNVYIDLIIENVNTDLFKSKLMLDAYEKQEIINHLKEVISPLKKDLPKTLTKPLVDPNNEKYLHKTNHLEQNLNHTKIFLTKAFSETGKISAIDDFEIIKDKLRFTYNADDGKKITMNLIKSKQKDIQEEWLQLIPITEENVEQVYEYDLKINLNHPYFKEFVDDQEIMHKLEHFFVCYAIAECITRLDGSSVTQLKYEINKLLRGNNDK